MVYSCKLFKFANMKKISIPEYANIMRISRQAVHKSVKKGKLSLLKGVSAVEIVELAKGRIVYILSYEPENESPKPLPE